MKTILNDIFKLDADNKITEPLESIASILMTDKDNLNIQNIPELIPLLTFMKQKNPMQQINLIPIDKNDQTTIQGYAEYRIRNGILALKNILQELNQSDYLSRIRKLNNLVRDSEAVLSEEFKKKVISSLQMTRANLNFNDDDNNRENVADDMNKLLIKFTENIYKIFSENNIFRKKKRRLHLGETPGIASTRELTMRQIQANMKDKALRLARRQPMVATCPENTKQVDISGYLNKYHIYNRDALMLLQSFILGNRPIIRTDQWTYCLLANVADSLHDMESRSTSQERIKTMENIQYGMQEHQDKMFKTFSDVFNNKLS